MDKCISGIKVRIYLECVVKSSCGYHICDCEIVCDVSGARLDVGLNCFNSAAAIYSANVETLVPIKYVY